MTLTAKICIGLVICLYADALTLVSAESKDFESGEEEEVETPYIGMNVSRQLRLTRMLDNLIIRILLALILGTTVHDIHSHPSMVSGYARRTWCTCEWQADYHEDTHQQHLSKISSKSLVVSNIKYMSVTWLSICHCTSEVGWQTDYEDTPLHHKWVRALLIKATACVGRLAPRLLWDTGMVQACFISCNVSS